MVSLFRLIFLILYDSFISLSKEVEVHELSHRWSYKDASDDKPSNIKLLLFGDLRYISRAWTLNDVEELTSISREVNQIFSIYFRNMGVQLYTKSWY